MASDGACVTGKIRYRTASSARIALALAAIRRPDDSKREQRAYPCPRCKGWHVTSKAAR